tara:strand:- start:136 stop:852 length:717 start_codon:yes stop_codon:yes gene_type:complete
MRKILLVSGDSWTDKNFGSAFHPELDTSWPKWPELLAEKLDMDCVNVGKSGMGNEYIFSTLLDKIVSLDNIGLVIAGWTQCHRIDWRNYGRWFNNAWDPNKDVGNNNNDIISHINKSFRYYYSLQEICKSKKIPLKQFQMLHMFTAYVYDNKNLTISGDLKDRRRIDILKHIHNSPYFNKINDDFVGWPGDPNLDGYCIRIKLWEDPEEAKKYTISDIDKHPNAKGQEKIMKFIYEQL